MLIQGIINKVRQFRWQDIYPFTLSETIQSYVPVETGLYMKDMLLLIGDKSFPSEFFNFYSWWSSNAFIVF